MNNYSDEIKHLERLANTLDSRFNIPGIPITFGLDALIGLIPVLGDTLTFTSTAYILSKAHKFKLPLHIKARIIWNGFVDWVIGFIPLVGDLLDVGWKSNQKNVALVKEYLIKNSTLDNS